MDFITNLQWKFELILVQFFIDFRLDSTGYTALTAEAEAKLVSIKNIKNAMDHNFDMASCTLKEDELLTKTEVRDNFFYFSVGMNITNIFLFFRLTILLML